MPFLIRNPPRFFPGKTLTEAVRPRDMLEAMQQPAAAPPAPPSHSFAELLAALDAPAQQREPVPASQSFAEILAALDAPSRQREPAWSDEGLADDYSTLSYERALQAHARYRSADLPIAASDSSLTGSADPGPIRIREAFPAATPSGLRATSPAVSSSHGSFQPEAACGMPLALGRNLKSASITIRLSRAECAQLRKRAAEAGLTVSAYLRSCTFEAEALRAQVKDALAQMRSLPPIANRARGDRAIANQTGSTPVSRFRRQWWRQLWPWAHSTKCIAQA
jgi:hypothetical protein